MRIDNNVLARPPTTYAALAHKHPSGRDIFANIRVAGGTNSQEADHHLMNEACILKTAESVTHQIRDMLSEIFELTQARLDASKLEMLASIKEGNMAYVGYPNGTHVWCPVDEVFTFVGSGGTHGVCIIMLLLGLLEDSDETRAENPEAARRPTDISEYGNTNSDNGTAQVAVNIDIGQGSIMK
ncbi:MAG: hypothetical protein FWD96_00440 [Defluviitaleaceae bacterium]|nr:hypothetical protein [Defluviitaleaceae bacterium]